MLVSVESPLIVLGHDRIRAMQIKEVVTAARSPWQNAYVERIIGSIRRECLNHVIIFNEHHLRGVLFHKTRTHLSLDKDCPETRPVHRPAAGKIIAFSQVGGLHHCYERRAA
jgi:putative transposase